MEALVILGLLITGGLFLGAIFGWIAFFQQQSLKDQLDYLRNRVQLLEQFEVKTGGKTPEPQPVPQSVPQPDVVPQVYAKTRAASFSTSKAVAPQKNIAKQNNSEQWLDKIKSNWMIWVGGASIGLSGIFLVKYSIDQGLLGPLARITLALLTGIAFHALALKLTRKHSSGKDAFAALAGGASIILYAALLAALHLYNLWSPGLVFFLLILVSLGTMMLALIHGPVLAAIGILGAYLVPILVNTGSNNVVGALIYVSLITASALLLMRYVNRSWLWLGTLAGALVWWMISMTSDIAAMTRPLYLLVLAYSLIAIPKGDWFLKKSQHTRVEGSVLNIFFHWEDEQEKRTLLALFVILAAQLFSLIREDLELPFILAALALPIFSQYLSRYKTIYLLLAWPTVFVSMLGILFNGLLRHNNLNNTLFVLDSEISGVATTLALLALSTLFLSLRNLKQSQFKGYWASLAWLSPVLALALAYTLITALRVHWEWSVAALILGFSYLLVLQKQKNSSNLRPPPPEVIATLVIAAHLAYSLAVVMFLREATLTLAIAAQAISLVWLERKYNLRVLVYATKIVLVVVITRLTLNPWLLTYPTDMHWSLWVCGGSCLAAFVSAYLASNRHYLQQWLQGAALHLLALTLIYEVRYQLYDGYIFIQSYSFLEAAINTAVWGLLGNVYLYRARSANTMQTFYSLCAYILLLAATLNYMLALLLKYNPLWTNDSISSTPVFNLLLLAYGMPIVLCALCYYLINANLRKLVGCIGAFTLLYFVSIEIRHLWQGQLDIHATGSDGEHYTYSMAWLLIAVIGTVLGIRFSRTLLYKGAMIFLLAVVAKIFLLDMAGLTSLWRVGSFMALGLCLLGLAWFHQRIRASLATN